MVNRKLVLELSLYNDGDWSFGNIEWLTKHVSRYFDNDFYEYTNHDEGYRISLRRVFDINTNTNIMEIVSFLDKIKTNINGRENYIAYIQEFLQRAKESIMNYAINDQNYIYDDDIYSNSEAEIYIYTTKKNVPQIMKIIYEDGRVDCM